MKFSWFRRSPEPGSTSPPAAVESDLLPDTALRAADLDRLGHGAVAAETVRLVTSVPAPATIGLFGAWGSGKSGIGNLVGALLEKHHAESWIWVRVDAFRHAGDALTREVIRALAAAVDRRNAKDLDDPAAPRREEKPELAEEHLSRLKDARTSSVRSLRLTGRAWFVVVAVFLLVVALGVVLLAAAASADHKLTFWPAFKTRLPLLLPALLPGALIGALSGLFARQVSVDTRSDPPSASDEFESIFTDVVRCAHPRQVAVFVDELDRCTSEQVLESLGGSEPCSPMSQSSTSSRPTNR